MNGQGLQECACGCIYNCPNLETNQIIHQLVHNQLGIPAQDPEKRKGFTADVYSTGKTLKWILLSEGSQVQKATYSDSIYRKSLKRQTHRDTSRSVVPIDQGWD